MNFYKTFSLLVLSTFLNIFAVCSASNKEENARRSVRGREMIMDNLRRFHGGQEPIPFVAKSFDAQHNGYFPVKDLPDDIFLYIADDMSCLNESNSLLLSCKYADQLRERIINKKLVDFNPHYLFEEQWLNNYMYRIIKENFPSDMKLKSEEIHDYVELMTLKFIENSDKPFSEDIPRHLHHALITFIHETVYGPGENVPVNRDSWLFYTALKDKGFNLQRTFEFYYQLFGKENHIYYWEYFQLIHPEQLPTFQWRFGLITPEIAQFEWADTGFLPENESVKLLELLGKNQIYSEHILNRIPLTTHVETFLVNQINAFVRWAKSRQMYLRFRKFLYRKFGKPLEKPSNCSTYIDTRDYDHPFDVQELQAFPDYNDPWIVFNEIVENDLPYLIKMEMLSKLVRSGLVPLNLKEQISDPSFKVSALQELADNTEYPFFELVLIEYPQLINLENLKVWNVIKSRKDLILATQFISYNPFAVVKYFRVDVFTAKFAEKFNLNVAYDFGCGIDDISGLFSMFPKRWIGKTLTFREILRDIHLHHTCDRNTIISLDFEETEAQRASYPIISIRAYLDDPNSVTI